jgi:hypothetical protein
MASAALTLTWRLGCDSALGDEPRQQILHAHGREFIADAQPRGLPAGGAEAKWVCAECARELDIDEVADLYEFLASVDHDEAYVGQVNGG